MSVHCINCGRFVGEDAIELQDGRFATPDDPDGWTGTFVCAPGTGCRPGHYGDERDEIVAGGDPWGWRA